MALFLELLSIAPSAWTASAATSGAPPDGFSGQLARLAACPGNTTAAARLGRWLAMTREVSQATRLASPEAAEVAVALLCAELAAESIVEGAGSAAAAAEGTFEEVAGYATAFLQATNSSERFAADCAEFAARSCEAAHSAAEDRRLVGEMLRGVQGKEQPTPGSLLAEAPRTSEPPVPERRLTKPSVAR